MILKLLILCLLALGDGARILAPFFLPVRSHFMMTNAIIRELVKRGHEVTFITPLSLAKENLGPNYKEILLPHYDTWADISQIMKTKSALDMVDMPKLTHMRLAQHIGVKSTDFALAHSEVQELIHAKNKTGKFDLLLVEQFYNEGALMLGHLYQIPVITLSTFAYANYFSQIFGFINPLSYVPNVFLSCTDRMTLWERLENVVVTASEDIVREVSYYPAQDAVIRKHFANVIPEVPTVKELERNISLILLNSYMPLTTPRPMSLNMISVGGLHILPPKPLPEHIKNFLDEAEHGAIYFSLGSQVRSADMPPEKLKIFLEVFASLKQRVLWKFENDQLPNLPDNVKVEKWLPQSDILAHPKIKVFFAHGGLFGMQEAVYHAVPVLGMPFYFDQNVNIKEGEAAGYAIGLDYRTISKDLLKSALIELLTNSKYKANMDKASRIFRDRPLGAMDTAIYWIDYVVEHRGAPHMVAAGVHLPWYKFYLLDVVAILLAMALCPLLTFYVIYRKTKSVFWVEKNEKKSKSE
ncbi:UDP-glycosyltransferase UGT5 [Drosophila eugracilis]|uniref:UDP-glycosyltransferase UGT5 n=1 Tax=Drosophila eugracilis TaxID=29029 RepID=UPI001BD9F509|nr:UDP-glycosyltransferase UGT5 [Drosophila eugracilis]